MGRSFIPLVVVALVAGSACGPAAPGWLRVVNATGAPLDATWDRTLLSDDLPATEASPFLPVPAGRAALEVTRAAGGAVLARATLEAAADTHTSLLVTPGPRLTSLVHRFAAPGLASLRVRLVHTADEALTAAVGVHQVALSPGGDSGPEGLELPAGEAAPLTLRSARGAATFTVPALPAGSEVLLVIVQAPGGPSVLGVAPSAVLGFLTPGGAP